MCCFQQLSDAGPAQQYISTLFVEVPSRRPCDRDTDAPPCRQSEYDMSALEVAEDAPADEEAVQAMWQDADVSFLSGDEATAELVDVETVGSQVRGCRDSPGSSTT